VFEVNYAQIAGGGVFGGAGSDVVVEGCTFRNNTSLGYGGGMVVSTATLGGGTAVTDNVAEESGGGVSA